MSILDLPTGLEGTKPFIHQTPGRHVYYYGENEFYLPDSIKYEIRMPSRYAGVVDSNEYLPEVQAKMLEFLNSNLKTNMLDPERGFDLDMTVREAQLIAEASDSLKSKAEVGEVTEVVTHWKHALKNFHEARDELFDKLNDAFNASEEQEKAALESIEDHFIASSNSNGTAKRLLAHIKENPTDGTAKQVYSTLYSVAQTKAQISALEVELIDAHLHHVSNSPLEQESAPHIIENAELAKKFWESFEGHNKGSDLSVYSEDTSKFYETLTALGEA